ncbi:glycosyltransferase family 2 protein [Flagellimonas myxillae]|uniref:glycosyltransferase family 2 protein n=1 Tax=Flagellimonas myxillae TaxID=2942214 RepID=UPI00201F39FE|nr:glycosyltransferase family 2 protein [Muricauda myxillae]MCL6264888.1 glycosyltransferase family 2 protein [Muricauda myxillae]
MKLSVIIPAHNEGEHLQDCLNAFASQTHKPDELILVDDNSTDNTFKIATEFAKKNPWVKVLQRKSTNAHNPGKKVVDTFNFGLKHVSDYDLIGKFDADIILPSNYFDVMLNHFQSNWKLGMCSGLLYVRKESNWIYENISDKNHIRGPIKLYHKACFKKIGGLRPGVGWDTVDELLAKYHGFETITVKSLEVKHLRPTGHGYTTQKRQSKGEALYKMRYGIVLAKLAALKMAWQAGNPWLYHQVIVGYLKAFFKQQQRYVSRDEGAFIRKYRWNGILKKVSAS